MDSVDRRRFGCRRFRSQLVHPITLSIIATGYSCFVSDPRTFSGRNGIADFPIGAGKGRPTRSKPRSGVSPKTLAPRSDERRGGKEGGARRELERSKIAGG